MTIRRSRYGFVARPVLMGALFSLASACGDGTSPSPGRAQPSSISEELESKTHEALRFPARVITDKDGVPHLFAATESDLMYVEGYVHARDRLFQMDVTRRTAQGTLAELLGEGALSSDVQLRTLGVGRAAERSLPVASPEVRAALESYAAGVNAFVRANALPPEYAALEVSHFRPWTEVDSLSVVKILAFQLSFDLGNDINSTLTLRAYQAAGQQRGFDGAALFALDTNRVAPFDEASAVPDALLARTQPPPRRLERSSIGEGAQRLSNATLRLAREYLEDLSRAPYAENAMHSGDGGGDRGSNSFVVAGRLSATGQPLIAGDQHLNASAQAAFYHVQLHAPAAGIDVIGASLPGAPYIVLGNNQRIAWTSTTSMVDVTDAYQERVVADPASPSGLSTLYKGAREPVVSLAQSFRFNVPGDGVTDNLKTEPPGARVPPAVLIVPRRNQGPIVQINPAAEAAISVQYVGWSGTRELDAFRGFTRARNVSDFERALQNFDVGSQNFSCIDVNGDVAYFLSGEVPLREDLQAGKVSGLPPTFIRDGQGGNEWIPATGRDPTRSLSFEILPAAEMPRAINPPRGFVVSSNNDPSGGTLDNDPFNERRPGGGILYFSGAYQQGIRAGRITELLEERLARRGRLTTSDLKAIQADTVMKDARYFTPFIVAAFANARKASAHPSLRQAAADPRVIEAVARLEDWDQSTPTGIREGYDENDAPGALREPSADEIRHSVAATIYSIWRNQFLSNVVVGTLTRLNLPLLNNSRREALSAAKNLLERFGESRGVGASGVDFFEVPGIEDAATRRDVVVLRSLSGALDFLAGDTYAGAFRRSTNQDDYRWGRLHRIVFPHPLGGPFSVPPAFGAFPAPFGPELPGIPLDGGLETVDVGNNVFFRDSLPDALGAFVTRVVAAQRYVARPRALGRGFDAETSLHGGESGVPGTPFYVNLLEPWLTNETFPLRDSLPELLGDVASVENFQPDR